MNVIKRIIKKNGHLVLSYMRSKKYIEANRKGFKYTQVSFKEKKVINVLFIINFPETWNSVKSLYNYMLSDSMFCVNIITVPKHVEKAKDFEDIKPEWDEASLYFENNGISHIRAYKESGWLDPCEINYDYVIYTRPYNREYPPSFRSYNMCLRGRVCYIPYAYSMLSGQMIYVIMPEDFIYSTHKVYLANESRKKQCEALFLRVHKADRNRFEYLGFPRFDLAYEPYNIKMGAAEECTIAWLPRWTSSIQQDKQKAGNFLAYYDDFIKYALNNINVKIIIRPHPKMIETYLESGDMTEQQVAEFTARCNSIPNLILDYKKDYMDTLKSADILVADYTSLLAEFFITGKPIIFCDSSEGLNEEGKLITENTYFAGSFEDIVKNIEMLIKGDDKEKSERDKIIKHILPSEIGHIGESIAKSIKDDFYK